MREFLALCIALCAITCTNSECTTDDGIQTDLKFPNIFDESVLGYSVSVEFNNMKEKQTVFVKEYYDISLSNGRTEIWRKGDYKDFRYINKTNEAFTYTKFQCESNDLDVVAPPFLEDLTKNWLDVETKDGVVVRYVYGPSAMFRQAYKTFTDTKDKIVYLGGNDDVRSIPVNKWKQCDGDNEIKYYFTKSFWTNPYGKKFQIQLPVRVTYKGGEGELEFDQVYDFIKFEPYVSSDENFRILEGRGCERKVQNEIAVPKFFNTDHIIRGEVVYYPIDSSNVYSHFVSTIQLVYHQHTGLIMYRFAPWKVGTAKNDKPPEASHFKTTVWDNENSVVFEMDDETGECEIDRDPDYYPSFPLPDEGEIDLLHPEILLNNTNFKFIGRTKIRGIPVLIYEKAIPNMFFGKKVVPLAVITRYYAEDDTIIGSGTGEDNNPLRINIGLYDDAKKTKVNSIIVINIFSFVTDVQRTWALFDVSRCFRNYDERQWFKVTFDIPTGISADSLRVMRREIQEEFLGSLYMKTSITPARVARILVDIKYDTLSVEVLLLERPPLMLEFSMRGSEELETYDYSESALSLEDCTKACAEYDGGSSCRVISFCGVSCFISKTANAKSKTNMNCLTFDRKYIMSSIPTLSTLLSDIQTVTSQDFGLYLEVNNGDILDHVHFPAVSYEDEIHMGKDDTRLKERDFVRKQVGYKIVPDENTKVQNYGKQSISYCKRICRNNPYCETISYCFGTNICTVSEEYRSEISLSSIAKDTQCVIYGRDYISAYRKHVGVVLTRKAEQDLSENSAEDCARMCSSGRFKCNSFDYCEQNKACLLHAAHIFDEKAKENAVRASNCTHYSKKFIHEFKQIRNKRIKGNGDLVLRDVNSEECAKQCVETTAFQCSGFDYCEATEAIDNRCVLTSSGGDAETITKPSCNRYYRTVNKLGSTSSKYSQGLYSGLGILFFIIGCVIGIGGTLAFGYYRANRRR